MPRADGYVMGSLGNDFILPPMPPERSTDIARKDNVFKNNAIKSCFWPGPKLRTGYYTTDPDDYGLENQIPDIGNTFSTAWFKIPAGAKIVMKGNFPHMRHWSFVTYTEDGVPRDGMHDIEIEPDAGSSNPFRAGVRRDVEAAPLHDHHRQRHAARAGIGAPGQHPLHAGRARRGDRHAHAQLRARPQHRLDRRRRRAPGRAAPGRRQGAPASRRPVPPPTRRGAASRCR